MAEPLKNIYSEEFIRNFAEICKPLIPNFSEEVFSSLVFTEQWNELELKQRMQHLTDCLHKVLPENFTDTVSCLIEISEEVKKISVSESNYEYIFISDYIASYGLKYPKESLYAIEKLTQMASAEFAIRPFILKYEEETMAQMLKWSEHENHTVRRLSSEGCRPRLPWGISFPKFKKDPSCIFPILENLKNDSSLFVRKSVANNLNDISKDNPSKVVQFAKNNIGKTENTDWILKHALRTLLKQGDSEALLLFGYSSINASSFSLKLMTEELRIGEDLQAELEFSIDKLSKLRLEYSIGYKRQNNKFSEKVFQISEKEFEKGTYNLKFKRPFTQMSTRKLYAGEHYITLIVNGRRLKKIPIMLL